jgi:hypothetical protein
MVGAPSSGQCSRDGTAEMTSPEHRQEDSVPESGDEHSSAHDPSSDGIRDPTEPSAEHRDARGCGFCGKSWEEVGSLIQGPPDTGICHECVALCVHLIAEPDAPPSTCGVCSFGLAKPDVVRVLGRGFICRLCADTIRAIPGVEADEVPSRERTPVLWKIEGRVAREDGHAPCCSFCGKSYDDVRMLIGGRNTTICDECVDLCLDVIEEESGGRSGEEARADPNSDGRGSLPTCGVCSCPLRFSDVARVLGRGSVCRACAETIRALPDEV